MATITPPACEEAGQRRSGGRPTRDEAARRDERVMEVAASLFLDRGFDLASMDALAELAGVSKATLYSRFGDKRQLFITVIRHEIGRWLAPLSAIVEEVIAGDATVEIEIALIQVGRQLTQRSLEPRVVALGRVVSMQASVFPELAQLAHEEGWLRAVATVARLLSQFMLRGQIAIPDVDIAADLLLNLVLGRATRQAAYGMKPDADAMEKRLQAAVRMFLYGTASRGAPWQARNLSSEVSSCHGDP
ncbi:MAG: TetR/AcrR family transcriptional regulator [Janthinobacterium lividum]